MADTLRLNRSLKVGYGVADLGASLSFVAVSTWLFYFFVNIVGLPPILAGTAFLTGRLFDAAIDPLMGSLSDRLKGRFGRKPFIRWGAVPLGISFASMWLIPSGDHTIAFTFGLTAFLLFSLLYTVVQVPYMSLTPELAPDYDERTRLTSYRIGFGTLASLLAVAGPPALVLWFAPGSDLAASAPHGWVAMGVVFGLLTTLPYLIMTAVVPEPRRRQEPRSHSSLLSEARSAFRIFGFPQMFVLFMILTVGTMIVNSLLPFYLESAARVPAGQQPLVLGLLFVTAVLSFPLWSAASARVGKPRALVAGLLLLTGGLLALVLGAGSDGITPFLLTSAVVSGIGLSAQLMLPWAMLPDVVEFDAAASGRRREGLVYALFTFGQKTAGSLAVFANGVATTIFGYQQGLALQDPETVSGLRLMTGPVPALIFITAAILAWRFPITRERHRRIQAELDEGTTPT